MNYMNEGKKEQNLINENQMQQKENTEQILQETEQFAVSDSLEEVKDDFNQPVYEAEAVKKTSFREDLSKQAVAKIFFLFAGIGFFFPFFTVACQGQSTGLTFKGIDLLKGTKIPIQQGMDLPIPKQPLIIAAFAVIVIGLILTVFLKGMPRYIAGAVCSVIPASIMVVFAIILQQTIIDEFTRIISTEFKMEDPSQLGNMSEISPIFEAGYYFVLSLLIINFIYFIVQIALESKRQANKVMQFEGEGDFEDVNWEEATEEIQETNVVEGEEAPINEDQPDNESSQESSNEPEENGENS